MITQSDTVIAPYHGGAACAAAGGDLWATFAVFLTVATFGREPIARRGGYGETAGCFAGGTPTEV